MQKTKNVEFVAFVDSDDIIKPHAYEQAIAPMKNDKDIDCIIFGAEAFGEASQKRLEDLNRYLKIKHNGKVQMNERVMLKVDNTCWTKLFCFDLFQKYKLYFPPIKTEEDTVLKFYYLTLCKNAYFIDEIFYLYRQRRDSTTSAFLLEPDRSVRGAEILYNFKYIAEFYKKNGFFESKLNSLCKIYTALVKSILYMNTRVKTKEILDMALKFGQGYFLFANSKDMLNRNQLHQKFKFGNDIIGHSKELLCVDLLGETILVKRRHYFLHFLKRKFKILTTIYTNNEKISYIKFGRTKLIIHKKEL